MSVKMRGEKRLGLKHRCAPEAQKSLPSGALGFQPQPKLLSGTERSGSNLKLKIIFKRII